MVALEPEEAVSRLASNDVYPGGAESVCYGHRIVSVFVPVNLGPKVAVFVHSYVNGTAMNDNFNTFVQLRFSRSLVKYNIFVAWI